MKWCRSYLLCGYKASSLTQGLEANSGSSAKEIIALMFSGKLTRSLFLLAHTAYPLLTAILTSLKNVIHRALLLFMVLVLWRIIMRVSGVAQIAELDKAWRQYPKMCFAEVHRKIANAFYGYLHHTELICAIVTEGAWDAWVLAHAC